MGSGVSQVAEHLVIIIIYTMLNVVGKGSGVSYRISAMCQNS